MAIDTKIHLYTVEFSKLMPATEHRPQWRSNHTAFIITDSVLRALNMVLINHSPDDAVEVHAVLKRDQVHNSLIMVDSRLTDDI